MTRLLSTLDRHSQGFQASKDWENIKRHINTCFLIKPMTHYKSHSLKGIQSSPLQHLLYSTTMFPSRANSHHAQQLQFQNHTKALHTHFFTSEPPYKLTPHTPNTWHRPQTNPTSGLAAPHSTPVNRQTHQNHNVRGRAGQNRTPYYITDNTYNNINHSYPRTSQYRHYTHSNTHFLPPTSLHTTYLPNNTDSCLQTPHYKAYLPRDTNSTEEHHARMHHNTDNAHQNVHTRVGC